LLQLALDLGDELLAPAAMSFVPRKAQSSSFGRLSFSVHMISGWVLSLMTVTQSNH